MSHKYFRIFSDLNKWHWGLVTVYSFVLTEHSFFLLFWNRITWSKLQMGIIYQENVHNFKKWNFRLFTHVNENHFSTKPTFQKFIALLDNYNYNIGQTEDLTSDEWAEIEDFLTEVIKTQVMQLAYGYLLNNSKTHFDKWFCEKTIFFSK